MAVFAPINFIYIPEEQWDANSPWTNFDCHIFCWKYDLSRMWCGNMIWAFMPTDLSYAALIAMRLKCRSIQFWSMYNIHGKCGWSWMDSHAYGFHHVICWLMTRWRNPLIIFTNPYTPCCYNAFKYQPGKNIKFDFTCMHVCVCAKGGGIM